MAQNGTTGNAPLAKGEYRAPLPTDIRSPCPMINSLANHGYIPRDGRSIRLAELKAAVAQNASVSKAFAAILASPVFDERRPPGTPPPGFLARLWAFVWNPFSASRVALREPGQVDSEGVPVVNLDQLARHGMIEHDASFSRRDYGEAGDATTMQKDLVEGLLATSKDGEYVTAEDLVEYKKKRIEQSKEANSKFTYGSLQHLISSGEIALILNVLGDGQKVPVRYLDVWFKEERLPLKEGWTKRASPYGVFNLYFDIKKVKQMMGMNL